jgi:hypothetical protein
VQLKNTKGNIQRGVGKALYNVHESLPGDWQTFTDNNIRLSEQVTIRPHDNNIRLSEQVTIRPHDGLPGDCKTFTDYNIHLSEQVTI